MTYSWPRRSEAFLFIPLLSAMIFMLFATPLQAADPQDNQSKFSFHKPKIFFGGHAGINFPQAKGDIFGTAIHDLTLKKSDFQSPIFGFDFGVYIHSHFAAVASLDYGRALKKSEYRDFVEDNGNSIIQTNRLSQFSLLGTLRYYPRKTGEKVGSYSWIPTRILPYVGAGAGLVHYNFSQQGDFVNFTNDAIFTDLLVSKNPALMTQLSAGLDFVLTRRIIANVESRYSWAHGDISMGLAGYSRDYLFDSIDLNGLKTIAGISFRF
jgi:opacity protein-like surface antigen